MFFCLSGRKAKTVIPLGGNEDEEEFGGIEISPFHQAKEKDKKDPRNPVNPV
jgi:hypothetical protein